MERNYPSFAAPIALLWLCAWSTSAQELTPANLSGPLSERRSLATPDHPSIGYSVGPFSDAVAELNRRLQSGDLQLRYDPETGYLQSILDALKLSTTSQLLVYSKTSLQASRISPSNPRALYFSDHVVVGYIRGAPLLEFAVVDPKRGVEFYTLSQRESPAPRLTRGTDCLRCHESLATLDVPGLLLRSVPTGPDGQIYPQLGNSVTDHRSPIDQRWGGWYVTGAPAGAEHMGNVLVRDPLDENPKITASGRVSSLEGRFEQRGYLSPRSDIAALLVFEHQMRMSNLLVRMSWDTRFALSLPASSANTSLTRTLLANNFARVCRLPALCRRGFVSRRGEWICLCEGIRSARPVRCEGALAAAT